MYLTRSIQWRDKKSEMVGLIAADTVMQERPVGRGLVKLERMQTHPWRQHEGDDLGQEPLQAHEFHYSRLINIDPELKFAYRVKRGYGIDRAHDGLVTGNIFASYAHLKHSASNPWVNQFLKVVAQH